MTTNKLLSSSGSLCTTLSRPLGYTTTAALLRSPTSLLGTSLGSFKTALGFSCFVPDGVEVVVFRAVVVVGIDLVGVDWVAVYGIGVLVW